MRLEQVAWAAITQLDSGESTKTPGTQDALALRGGSNGRFSKKVEASGPNLDLVRRVRDGRLRTIIGNVSTLDDAVAALTSTQRLKGKTIIRVRP
jgi:NADPH:quinone reductase-like Zn-dependent oxidoreductase